MKKDHKYLSQHLDDLDYPDSYPSSRLLWRGIKFGLVFMCSIIGIALTPFWLSQIKATKDVKTAIIFLAIGVLVFMGYGVYKLIKRI